MAAVVLFPRICHVIARGVLLHSGKARPREPGCDTNHPPSCIRVTTNKRVFLNRTFSYFFLSLDCCYIGNNMYTRFCTQRRELQQDSKNKDSIDNI